MYERWFLIVFITTYSVSLSSRVQGEKIKKGWRVDEKIQAAYQKKQMQYGENIPLHNIRNLKYTPWEVSGNIFLSQGNLTNA